MGIPFGIHFLASTATRPFVSEYPAAAVAGQELPPPPIRAAPYVLLRSSALGSRALPPPLSDRCQEAQPILHTRVKSRKPASSRQNPPTLTRCQLNPCKVSPMRKAPTTELAPGQSSIDRVTPFQRAGRDGWTIKWHLRLHDGRLWRESGTMTSAATKGQARAKAKRIAAEALKGGGLGRWSGTSKTSEYLEAVTLPAIKADRLAPNTQARYLHVYHLLRGECRTAGCSHKHALAGLNLRTAMRPRVLTDCLEEIAKLHGATNAKHAKTVARKYLAAPLKLDEVIDHNPLTDLDLDLSAAKKPAYSRGGRALSLAEYRAVIEYLLALDPEDVEAPKRGRWTLAQRIVERRALIDIVLAQAATGLRTSELCHRPVSDCYVDASGTLIIELPATGTKTKTSRPVPVIIPAVGERLAARLDGGSPWLFPSPADADKLWERRNRDRKLAGLYGEIAMACNIPMFERERGHSWRTTLNTLLHDQLPEAVRIRLLGHTAAVNRQHYTAVTSTEAVLSAAAVLRELE